MWDRTVPLSRWTIRTRRDGGEPSGGLPEHRCRGRTTSDGVAHAVRRRDRRGRLRRPGSPGRAPGGERRRRAVHPRDCGPGATAHPAGAQAGRRRGPARGGGSAVGRLPRRCGDDGRHARAARDGRCLRRHGRRFRAADLLQPGCSALFSTARTRSVGASAAINCSNVAIFSQLTWLRSGACAGDTGSEPSSFQPMRKATALAMTTTVPAAATTRRVRRGMVSASPH